MNLHEATLAISKGIENALQEKKGYLVGRNGTIELQVLCSPGLFTNQLTILEKNAGIFPAQETFVRTWKSFTENAIQNADVLAAGWYTPLVEDEKHLLLKVKTKAIQVPLRALEPYYVPFVYRWTNHLEGKRVAIVSSFANTCILQLQKKKEIWPDTWDSLLPDATYIPVQTGYSPSLAQGRAEWPETIFNWADACKYVVDKCCQENAEIVLIGCGGIGMPIAQKLKEKGKICIVMGGAIQVLFGIKGRRWEHHEIISQFWNDAWVWPPLEETPGAAHLIENSCYWN
jgi:hypothetical protein